MKTRFGLVILLSLVVALAAWASVSNRSAAQKARPAQNEAEWKALMASKDADIIRDMEGWRRYIARMDRNHPLARVDKESVMKFTEALVFRNGGLAGLNYDSLVDDIGVSIPREELFNLFEVFGLGDQLAGDRDDMYCRGVGTCDFENNAICTPNC